MPTLKEFGPRFLDSYARANRQKPSGIAAKEVVLRVHLIPALGDKTLDSIRSEDVQRLKRGLQAKAPKTVNNILTVLNVLLRKAVEWDIIERMPCSIRLLPVPKGSTAFHDFDEYERLIEVAQHLDPRTHLIVLLGGDAGCAAAKSSRSNGQMSTSCGDTFVSGAPTGMGRSRRRRAAGFGACR